MLTFQQKIENSTVLLQKSSHNTAGKWELGCVLPSCWEFHEIGCWDVRNGSLHFPEVHFFSKKHVYIFFPKEDKPFSWGATAADPPAILYLPDQGGWYQHVQPWPLIVLSRCVLMDATDLLMNEKHCGDGHCLHNGFNIFNAFSKEMGFRNLLHNMWKMCWVKTELLSKSPAPHLWEESLKYQIDLQGCGFAGTPPQAITLHCH